MEILGKVMSIFHKKKKNSSDLKNVVMMIRNHELNMPDVTLEYASDLIKKNKKSLGNDYYILLEELFFAGLECSFMRISNNCLKILQKQFPNSERVKRMQGLIFELNGNFEKAESFYDELIAENLTDSVSRKRKIAILRHHAPKNKAIDELNKYLELNMGDSEAWLELADIYLENMNFSKALFCYDELLLLNPKNFHYMTKIAEIYYTLGGLSNLQTAKSYYSYILSKSTNNTRALWGLYQVLKTLAALKKTEEKDIELLELTGLTIKKLYENKGSGNLIKNLALTK